jgi:predicted nucleotidyltransferase
MSSIKDIGGVLFPKTKRKILALFFLNPDSRFYYREIIKRIGSSPGPVQRELASLTAVGILEMESRGRQKFYRVNVDNPIFEELRGIVIKTFGVVDVLSNALADHDKLEIVILHGSVSSVGITAKNDIDLLVVGNLTFRSLSLILHTLEETLGRPINPTLYSPEQFAAELAAKNHFIVSVLNSKIIYIAGSKDDIERLAKQRAS